MLAGHYITRLTLFTEIYHNVDHCNWCITLYHHTTFSGTFVRCLPETICTRCLQRFYHNVDHWGIYLQGFH